MVAWYLPVHHWQGGTVLHDLTGRYDGTLTNMDPAADWIAGADSRIWGALGGFTSTAHVLLPDAIGDALESAGTVLIWWIHDGTTNAGHFFDDRSGGDDGWDLDFNSTNIRFVCDTGTQVITTTDVSALSAGLHLVAATYDGANTGLSVDAGTIATQAQTGLATRVSPVKLGNSFAESAPLTRSIVSAQFHDRAVSAAGLTDYFQLGQQFYPSLLNRRGRRVVKAAVAAIGVDEMMAAINTGHRADPVRPLQEVIAY